MTRNTYEIFFTLLRKDGTRDERRIIEEAETLSDAKLRAVIRFPGALNVQGQRLV